METIVLATSIAPKDIENQQNAIATWTDNGFHLISCNTHDEILMIREYFPHVEFVEMKRDSKELTGKSCPYIYDMLQVLKEKANHICGIINSDLYLAKFTSDIYKFISKNAIDQVLFIRRHDIKELSCIEQLDFELFFAGIDVFIFNKNIIDIFEDDGLIIGQAMWDYWFPIMLNYYKVKLKEIINPIVFHISHPIKWAPEITDDISWNICQKHFKRIERKESTYFLKDKFFEIISTEDIGLCYISEDLKHRAVLVFGDKKYCNAQNSLWAKQTHRNIIFSEDMNFKKEEYIKFILIVPYPLVAGKYFVDAAIWILENYNAEAIRLFTYLRGNISNVMRVENGCYQLIEEFHNDISPLIFTKMQYFRTHGSDTLLYRDCKTCICSVLVEEDEEKIWKREQPEHNIEGNLFIFPAGYVARNWVKRFRKIAEKIHIIGFVDNSENLQNGIIDGIKVYHPDILEHLEVYDKVLIISNLYTQEIYNQLCSCIPKEKVIIWHEYNGKNGLVGTC